MYLKWLREIANETDNLLRWETAIMVLSLDAISQFRRELGLGGFDIDTLRQVARRLLEETGVAWDYDVHPSELPTEYLGRVAKRMGTETAAAVYDWFSITFPYQPGEWQCLTVWRERWKALVKSWDAIDEPMALPLVGPAYTQYRLDVRRYVAEVDVIFGEIQLVTDLSDWDKQFEARRMQDWVTSSLWTALSNRITSLRLPTLLRDFPAEEVEVFSHWWRSHQWPEECLSMLER